MIRSRRAAAKEKTPRPGTFCTGKTAGLHKGRTAACLLRSLSEGVHSAAMRAAVCSGVRPVVSSLRVSSAA